MWYIKRKNDNEQWQRWYIVGVLDDCSRLAWCELTDDIQGMTVMFAIMRCLKALRANYGIEFREVITDNGPEFGGIDGKQPDELCKEKLAKNE